MSGPRPGRLAADLARIAALLAGEAAPPRAAAPVADQNPLDRLCDLFGLTPFERDVLLMCAGVELDASCAAAVRRAQDGGEPNFSLALARLPDAHWSALLPNRPLRYWRLVELAEKPSLVGAALRIDERILHHLMGLICLDRRLAGRASVVESPGPLVPSHAALVDRIVAIWRHAGEGERAMPVVRLGGPDIAAATMIAAAAAGRGGLPLLAIDGRDLPEEVDELETLLRLLDREAVLADVAVLLRGNPVAARSRSLDTIVERALGPVILAGVAHTGDRLPDDRATIVLDVARPPLPEQAEAWRLALAEAGVTEPPPLAPLAYQFDLGLSAIRAATLAAVEQARGGDGPLATALWRSARDIARAGAGDTLERITPKAGRSRLVLPPRELATLDRIIASVRDRPLLHGEWGFAGADGGDRRGLGVAAMFAGPSGTGKTLAAEVIARELDLDLYRIDLSQVVNKYIGETEKNLARVFDAAEAGGAILLFDEADALFGKRSEVKDSHDRHANIEVSYLLSRVETYSGIAILTTNLKDSIDQAFLRRMRFVVNFPFPDAGHRRRIWQTAFPAGVPLDAGVDPDLLAQLNVTGGMIRNIARNAASHAIDRHRRERTGESRAALTLADIRAAAVEDYEKSGRTLTATETRGWG